MKQRGKPHIDIRAMHLGWAQFQDRATSGLDAETEATASLCLTETRQSSIHTTWSGTIPDNWRC